VSGEQGPQARLAHGDASNHERDAGPARACGRQPARAQPLWRRLPRTHDDKRAQQPVAAENRRLTRTIDPSHNGSLD